MGDDTYKHPDTELGSLLAKVNSLMERILVRKMKNISPSIEIQPTQGGLLHILYDGNNHTIEEILKQKHSERTSITRLVSRMADKGLLTKNSIPGSRKMFIKITEKGEKAFSPRKMEEQFSWIFKTLTEDERGKLKELLHKVLDQEDIILKKKSES